MKKIIKILTIAGFLAFPLLTFAQQSAPPPTPNHGNSRIGGGDPPPDGGGAPIGGGLFILLGLGAAYGGKKVYDLKNKEE